MLNIKLYVECQMVQDKFLETPIRASKYKFLEIRPSRYVLDPHANSSTYKTWNNNTNSLSSSFYGTSYIGIIQTIYTKYYKGYMYEHETSPLDYELKQDQFIVYSTKNKQMFLNYLLKDYIEMEE